MDFKMNLRGCHKILKKMHVIENGNVNEFGLGGIDLLIDTQTRCRINPVANLGKWSWGGGGYQTILNGEQAVSLAVM